MISNKDTVQFDWFHHEPIFEHFKFNNITIVAQTHAEATRTGSYKMTDNFVINLSILNSPIIKELYDNN